MGRKKEVADEKILEVACACFLEHGPSVATSRIAKKVGVSQATLFNRFENKRDLMIKALRPKTVDWPSLEPDERPIREQLLELGVRAYHLIREIEPRIFILRIAGVTPVEAFQDLGEPPFLVYQRRMSHWLEVAQKRGMIGRFQTHVFRTIFMGSLFSLVQRSNAGMFPPLQDEEIRIELNAILDLLWQGIQPESNTSS